MTVICGGGTSSAKPGFGAFVYMAPSAVGALLNNIPTLWAVPLAAAIGAVTYEMAVFCTNDPPAVPTITASDITDILNYGDIGKQIAAANKFRDLVGAYAWYDLCQCDSVSTPAPPTPPSEPAGAPTLNPITTPGGPCRSGVINDKIIGSSFSSLFAAFVDVSDISPTTARVFMRNTSTGGGGHTVQFDWTWENQRSSPTTVLGHYQASLSSTGTLVPMDIPFIPGATNLVLTLRNVSGTGTAICNGSMDVYCNGASPSQPDGGCAPDTLSQELLRQILENVTLIQRQIVPFAFIDGDSHTGLSGDGSITLTDTRNGIRLELTTTPDRVGRISGEPDAVFDAGYVSLGDADGWFGTRAIRQSPLIWQPRWMGAVTRIGYSLTPGVVASITELRREP